VRALALSDAAVLKKLAADYMHPERPVICDEPAAFGRGHYMPAEEDDYDEKAAILKEAAALKRLVMDYSHPEKPVVCDDSTASARCYFDRLSAPQESDDEAEERALILAEAAALKKLAVDNMHPEMPVVCTDPTACARNYFSQPCAAHMDAEEEAERAQILKEARALSELADAYLNLDKPVVLRDATASARCFFTRPGAPEPISAEEWEARDQMLADAAALKELAVAYMHPEKPVVCTDPNAMARCYFNRPSAPETVLPESILQGEAAVLSVNFEDEEAYHNIRSTITKFQRSHSFGREEAKEMLSKEEEGHLSRSPSSVMLFEMGGGNRVN
jgi:hypothetical protein